ncbi:MAG: glucosaminidase domain-containing protein [Ktedonobacteraceae bacterium]|nr:glucosaminidase domain-containing protein [Ktedonobacteraceae bacterium]
MIGFLAGKQARQKQSHTSLFLILSMFIILVGGSIALLWQLQHGQSGKADTSVLIGQPILPATTVDAIFARVGSPMVGTGTVVEQAAKRSGIDNAFALAVWYVETNDGAAGVGRADRNPGGVKGSSNYPVAHDGYTIYPSYAAAITDWFNIVKSRYINRGLTSVYTICGPYVATATACSASGWAGKVSTLMQRYRAMAPAPTPTPHVSPTAQPTPPPVSSPKHGALHFVPTAVPQPQPTRTASATEAQSPTIAIAGLMITQQQTRSSRLTGQAVVAGLALLAALVLAAWGMLLRRGITAPVRNEDESENSEKEIAGAETLAQYSTAQFSKYGPLDDSHHLPVMQPVTEQLVFPDFPVRTAPVAGGLLSRTSKGDSAGQSLEGADLTSAQQTVGHENARESSPCTEAIPLRPGLRLPGRSPVAVESSRSGLLRHYRREMNGGK